MSVFLTIPVVENITFVLTKPTIVPYKSKENNTFQYIQTDYDYLAVSQRSKYYFSLSNRRLDNCLRFSDKRYLCKHSFSVLLMSSSRRCSVNLYLNRFNNNYCKISKIPATEILIELQREDSFIFTSYEKKSLVLNCTDRESEVHVFVARTHLLNLTGNCTLYTEKYKIYKQSVINYSRFTPLPASKMYEYKPEPFHVSRNENFEDQIKILKEELNENESQRNKSANKINEMLSNVTIYKIDSNSFNLPNFENIFDWFTFPSIYMYCGNRINICWITFLFIM